MTIMMTICTVFLIKLGTEEDLKKKRDIWNYLREEDPEMYRMVSRTLLGRAVQMRGPVGRRIIKAGYVISRKVFGFN